MRRIDRTCITMGAAIVVARLLVACGQSLPSPTDQAAVASYGTALEACVAGAKLRDAGLADYQACAAKVDQMWGIPAKDGGK